MNVRAVISQSDLARLARGIDLAVKAEPMRTVTDLATRAVRQLAALDRRLGHTALATYWTFDATATVDGARAVVYSAAKDLSFYNQTTRADIGRVRSSEYRISGDRLLAILEGGVRPHAIAGRKTGVLAFPFDSSNPAKARLYASIIRHGPRPAPEGSIRFAREVRHPGVAGNRNVETTYRAMVAALAGVADEAARRVTVSLV